MGLAVDLCRDDPEEDLIRVVSDHPGRWSKSAIAGAATIHIPLPYAEWVRVLDALQAISLAIYGRR